MLDRKKSTLLELKSFTTSEPVGLAPELRSLVKNAVALLGEVIRRERGERAYERIEALRRQMVSLRDLSHEESYAILKKNLNILRKRSPDEWFEVTHSFTLMLELMNACENAYRTLRITKRGQRGRQLQQAQGQPNQAPQIAALPSARHYPEAIVYVLTSHPTEARSPENIALFHQIQNDLVKALESDFESQRARILHSLEVVWRLSLSRQRKPTVADEAEYVYSISLREEVLNALIEFKTRTCPVYLRSWVGGDKEGHPGVNETVMQASLQLSRKYLSTYALNRLNEVGGTLGVLAKADSLEDAQAMAEVLLEKFNLVEKSLNFLEKIAKNDGDRVLKFKSHFKNFYRCYKESLGIAHPSLTQLASLLELFPALVVPLELREASSLIVAENQNEIDPKPFTQMLMRLKWIAGKANPKGYARGMVISLTSSLQHIEAACGLQEKVFGEAKIPVIPLFEQQEALERSTEVIAHLADRPKLRDLIHRQWHGHLEIMVGYSDSAKEMGVLPSRLMIADAIQRLDELCLEKKLIPLFFHGSGGSVDRGGGTIQEQTAWWPRSALNFYKATIQGEMVDRTLSTPEIAMSLLQKIAERGSEVLSEAAHRAALGAVSPAPAEAVERAKQLLKRFAEHVRDHYQSKIQSPAFMELVEKATAYRYLSELKIGSRPAKRASSPESLSVASLRAIPWVMCWTQTRILFPTWWGVGSAWNSVESLEARADLKALFQSNPLLSSFVKALGFTLAKVELPLWRLYLETSHLGKEQAHLAYLEFEREYEYAVAFMQAVTESDNLLSFRPWLGESVRLRSPLIHPLNLIQMLLLEQDATLDPALYSNLIRETVTGISSGLMTTG